MKVEEADKILNSWSSINSYLISINEAEDLQTKEKDLKQLLEREQKKGKRRQFLIRVHQKYTRVRAARERTEILEGKLNVK